jgi:hypothetical protein
VNWTFLWFAAVIALIIYGLYLIMRGWTESEKVAAAKEYAEFLDEIYPDKAVVEAAAARRRHLLSRGRFEDQERSEEELMRIGWVQEGYHLR